ncbi:class I SAM-dependent methyltransferase [Candidatus Woesearchaeota archaeon]|nr:class I SAM-dependent methyltransferase [Candidatus Woesearchaeota archaeon]
MILNKIEFMMMNNPLRAFIQKKIEIKRLRKYATLEKDKIVLEIGCGNGNGTTLIKQYFSPKKIYAIDLDPKMISLAKKKHNHDKTINLSVGNAAKLKFKSNQFDAVIDFGIIHHIPNWKTCLKEIKRVLKPGGELILEDLSIETFSTPFGRILKRILKHPYERMYTQEQFTVELQKLGFKIETKKEYNRGIKYFLIIAKK